MYLKFYFFLFGTQSLSLVCGSQAIPVSQAPKADNPGQFHMDTLGRGHLLHPATCIQTHSLIAGTVT